MEAVPIQRPQQCQRSGHARQTEPGGLVPGRIDRKIEGRACLVPHAAVIAGHHAEAVVTWLEVRILHFAFVDDLLPVSILAFQLEAKMDLVWVDQAEGGIFDLEIASQRGQAQVRRGFVFLAICRNLLDVYRRCEFVDGNVTRIDRADAVAWQEPYPSIRRTG